MFIKYLLKISCMIVKNIGLAYLNNAVGILDRFNVYVITLY